LTLKFEYNNISSLEKIFSQNPKEIAAIIMEPMTTEEPKDNFLQKVKDICHKHGALFILDETVT
jgi:glutamate-1-semialdehyde aminotransferase